MKHKHCEVIKAWADGAVVQILKDQEWFTFSRDYTHVWCDDEQYRASLAIVEGKPVFEGDALYYKSDGEKVSVSSVHSDETCQNTKGRISVKTKKYGFCSELPEDLSWNPPKPKTITVTIPVPLKVEFGATHSHFHTVLMYGDSSDQNNAIKAIKDAMK